MPLHRFSDIRPEGGYQDPKDYEGMHEQQTFVHEAPRCMYPGEFLSILHRFKHPRFTGLKVDANRWGARSRDEVGLLPAGTILASTPYEQTVIMSIGQNCLPYSSIKTAYWQEDARLWRFGELQRGWRSAIEGLISQGVLHPHDRLTYLIGKDTFKIGRAWWR